MTRRVLFRPQAEAELLEARAWYDGRREGLGAVFAAAVESTIDRISENPLAYSRIRGDTRRAVLRRFPYAVYFRVLADEIVVVAVMHGRRHPLRWQSRD